MKYVHGIYVPIFKIYGGVDSSDVIGISGFTSKKLKTKNYGEKI